MRRTALALLVASSGCNWVFGLTPTVANDAADGSPDSPPPIHTRLVWGAVTTDPTTGAPAPVTFAAIGSETTRPAVPMIQVGDPLGGMMPLQTVPYAISDGSFEIPYTLREAPHRIVYTLPGETVPHEVQWSVSGATLVVPRTARLDAAVVPPSSGYSMTPIGIGGHPSDPTLMTTGVFTEDAELASFDFSMTDAQITNYDYSAHAKPLTTPLGAPQASLGDEVILTNSDIQGSARTITGFAIAQLDLAANTLTAPGTQPPWITTGRSLSTTGPDPIPSVSLSALDTRMNALGALADPSIRGAVMAYGVSPSTGLPGFLPGVAPSYVPRPSMLTFMTSSAILTSFTVSDPSAALDASNNPIIKYERVISAGMVAPRMFHNATLTSSLQTVTTTFTGMVPFNVPLALNIDLAGSDLSTADGVAVVPSSQARPLTWTAATFPADDFVVTLFEITGGNLAPVRVYEVLAPAVTVDGSLLQPGHEYTFAITARKGFGNTAQGDFTAVSYPFSEATTFSAAITVQP